MLFANKCGTSVAATIKCDMVLFEFKFETGAELFDRGRAEEAVRKCHEAHFEQSPFLGPSKNTFITAAAST